MRKILRSSAFLLLVAATALLATTYSINQALTVHGTLTASAHTVFEGVTSTGATGTGKLVYDGSPTIATAILTTPNIGSAAANAVNYCADASGSTTTYTCTITSLSAYTTGMLVTFVPQTSNSGASTVNITGGSALGAKAIIAADTTGSALVADDLIAAGTYTLEYNGTAFRKINGPITAWTGFAYSNSWADNGGGFQAGQYMKDNFGMVHLRGLIKPGTKTTGTTMITLPVGYRPSGHILLFTGSDAAGVANSIELDFATNGVISPPITFPTANGFTTMEGMTFSVY